MNIGISNFAKNRHKPNNGYSYFTGTNKQLIGLIEHHWGLRSPGAGRDDLVKVVLVPVPAKEFRSSTVPIHEHIVLDAYFDRRQTFEEPFIKVSARGNYSIPKYVNIVCYSAAALEENNGERSGNWDWEIVSINASDVENEPMHPLAMARNFLRKPGGTFAPYTAEQFAEAIFYWSQRVSVAADND